MGLTRSLIRLARPHQWVKGGFLLIGPAYGEVLTQAKHLPAILGAFLAFGLASSACYVVNDVMDREADRAHPRKKNRPIASGAISVPTALWFALALLVGGLAACLFAKDQARWMLLACLGAYLLNTTTYSLGLKRIAILDVISLSLGFVVRVLGGCAAVGVQPSSWLLNCTFFVSMFLSLGKRLGERRVMGDGAAAARGVQVHYTDDLLRMAVVVTGVACLITYAGYVQAQEVRYTFGFNLLWLTMLPATYGLLRCIVLLERGVFDDPTEIAVHDRGVRLAGVVFVGLTGGLLWWAASQGRPAVGLPGQANPKAEIGRTNPETVPASKTSR